MNSPKTGLRVASVFFGIFAIGHLLRLINQVQVNVGTLTIPNGGKLDRFDRCRYALRVAVAPFVQFRKMMVGAQRVDPTNR